MVKILKRTSDNKYLKSLENDLWIDDISEAFEMTYLECEEAKNFLGNQYSLKEIVNVSRSKSISKGEIKEMRNILKNNSI